MGNERDEYPGMEGDRPSPPAKRGSIAAMLSKKFGTLRSQEEKIMSSFVVKKAKLEEEESKKLKPIREELAQIRDLMGI